MITSIEKQFPYVYKIGCVVTTDPLYHIKWDDLNKALKKNNIMKKFNQYFGIQTCHADGPYPSDVESVLTRIYTKKLIGIQLVPD